MPFFLESFISVSEFSSSSLSSSLDSSSSMPFFLESFISVSEFSSSSLSSSLDSSSSMPFFLESFISVSEFSSSSSSSSSSSLDSSSSELTFESSSSLARFCASNICCSCNAFRRFSKENTRFASPNSCAVGCSGILANKDVCHRLNSNSFSLSVMTRFVAPMPCLISASLVASSNRMEYVACPELRSITCS